MSLERKRSQTFYAGKVSDMSRRISRESQDRRLSEVQHIAAEELHGRTEPPPTPSTSTSSSISQLHPPIRRARHVSIEMPANQSRAEEGLSRRNSVACAREAESHEKTARASSTVLYNRKVEVRRRSQTTQAGAKSQFSGPAVTPRLRYTNEKAAKKQRRKTGSNSDKSEKCVIL